VKIERRIERHIERRAQQANTTPLATTLAVARELARCIAGDEPVPEWFDLDSDQLTPQCLARLVERAVNQRELGAYYTPTDVTLHIAREAVTSALDDRYGEVCTAVDIEQVRVLDPTCGSGAFLLAVVEVLAPLHAGLMQAADPEWHAWRSVRAVVEHCLHGADIVPEAVEMCKLQLQLAIVLASDGHLSLTDVEHAGQNIVVADVLVNAPWADSSFDVIVGNPPFVTCSGDEQRARGYDRFATRACRNLYAYTVERSLALLRDGGRIGVVLPISAVCVEGMGTLRSLLRTSCCELRIANFDTIPATLFEGVVQRLCIVSGRTTSPSSGNVAEVSVTKYHRWRASERHSLMDSLIYQPTPEATSLTSIFPKIGSELELRMLQTMAQHSPLAEQLERRGDDPLWYKRRWSYHLFFADFIPEVYNSAGEPRLPSELKPLHVGHRFDRMSVLAALCSSTFYWWFTVHSDNRNVNRREIEQFPFAVPMGDVARQLNVAAHELMRSLHENSELRRCTYESVGTITNRYFFQARTKPFVDRIDTILAGHYGFDADELAFLLGFDAEYRDERISAAAR
jgi:hypothetical protein